MRNLLTKICIALFFVGAIALYITTDGTGNVDYTFTQTLSLLALFSPLFTWLSSLLISWLKGE